jgi:CheY-like chemotaxis protein
MRKIDKVFLIDDDKINNYISESIIKKSGITDTVKVYLNGQEALEAIESNNENPDLILIDVNMPIMDGIEFLEQYGNERKDQSIIYLMHTSPLTAEQSNRLKNLPVKGSLLKPLTTEKLQTIVEKHF